MKLFLLKADSSRGYPRSSPADGSRIEFKSDRHTDKGPASGVVLGSKVTVDGLYITVKFADSQEMFSWDDIREGASKHGDLWMIKSHVQKKFPIAYRQKWRGLELAVETPAGSVRSGKKPNGAEWHTKMTFPYGEITGTVGVDGDPVDVFIGPDLDAPMVYVVHQNTVDDWTKYDEDKCFVGFSSKADAKAAFLANYDDPRFLGPITAMPVAEFIKKVRATREKPAMIKGLVLFMKASNGKPPTPGKVVKEGGKDKIVEDLDGLISEHEHLVGMLDKEPGAEAKTEASEEDAELKGFKRKKKVADAS